MLAPLQRQIVLAPPRFLARDSIPVLWVAVITAGLLWWFSARLCPDVSGQFWLAHAMRRGARIYVDVVEINPPLWFWLAVPIDALAETLGLPFQPVTIVVVALVVLAAMTAIGRLTEHVEQPWRNLFLIYVGAILLIMPARQLEQREHLALIAAIPYLVLAAARRRGQMVAPALALSIGIGAGVGLALKPYFLLVPVLIEAWLLAAMRLRWRPLRGETIGLAATVAAYAAAVALFTPAYFTAMIPMLLVGYSGVGPTLRDTLLPLTPLWTGMLVAILLQWRSSRTAAPITTALLIGAAAFVIGWAIQHKGWLYHGLPATGCFALALAAVLLETGAAKNRFVRIVTPVLLLWPMLFAVIDVETRITPANDIAPAVADLRPGDPFGLVAIAGPTSWPALIGRGLRLSSRYSQYWMINAVDQRPDDPAAAALMTRAIRETAFDYRCLPPKVIVFLDLKAQDRQGLHSSHPYALFARDPQFAAVLGHYRLWRTGPAYLAYRQASPLAPVDPARCRRPG